MTESFFSSLKKERVRGKIYRTRDEARSDVFDYIEVFYNRQRRHGHTAGVAPMMFDQGSQLTSSAFISLLQENGIQVSMDGKGCWRDNVFVERLWKSVKYEEIYLHGYDSVSEVRQALARYFDFYNLNRPGFRRGSVVLVQACSA